MLRARASWGLNASCARRDDQRTPAGEDCEEAFCRHLITSGAGALVSYLDAFHWLMCMSMMFTSLLSVSTQVTLLEQVLCISMMKILVVICCSEVLHPACRPVHQTLCAASCNAMKCRLPGLFHLIACDEWSHNSYATC